jgi:dihydrofolate reductase
MDAGPGPNWAVAGRPVSRRPGACITGNGQRYGQEPKMGRIVISANITLDGISQDPTGDEGFTFGGWFLRISDADREAWAKTEYEEALGTDAYLLGGRSYEWFADRWVGRAGGWAERMAGLPKYVVRSTAGRSDWGPTTVLRGDVVDEVSKLKQTIAGDIVVYASSQLVHTLLEHDLVDEVRLIVFPSVLGSGGRLFPELAGSKAVRLLNVETVGEGLVRLTYALVAPDRTASPRSRRPHAETLKRNSTTSPSRMT